MYVAVRPKLPIFHWSLLQNISNSLQLTTQGEGPLASMRAGTTHYVAVRLQNTAGRESLGDDGQYHLLSIWKEFLLKLKMREGFPLKRELNWVSSSFSKWQMTGMNETNNMHSIHVCNDLFTYLFKPAENKLNNFKSSWKSRKVVKTTVSKHPAQWQSQSTWWRIMCSCRM